MDLYIELKKEQYLEFMQFDVEKSFQMLNLLKFVDRVDGTNLSGKAQYQKYMQAVLPFFKAAKAKVIYEGEPYFTLIGPANPMEWDKVLIIEYATKAQFINMISAPGYPGKLRSKAIMDSRLILCK